MDHQSFPKVDSSIPLMHYDPRSLILIQIIPKERTEDKSVRVQNVFDVQNVKSVQMYLAFKKCKQFRWERSFHTVRHSCFSEQYFNQLLSQD